MSYVANVEFVRWSKDRNENDRPSAFTESLFDTNRWYQRRVVAPFSQPVPTRTVIIAITPDTEPQFTESSACMQRKLIGNLLTVAAKAMPAVIVLDVAFDPRVQCDQQGQPDADLTLRSGVTAVSESIPVVIARYVLPGKTFIADSIALGGKHVVAGLANRHPDHRRIALYFWVHDSLRAAESGEKPKLRETLALAAARAAAPQLLAQYPFLAGMTDNDVAPFTSFAAANRPNDPADPSRLRVFTPSMVICGREKMGGEGDLAACLAGHSPDLDLTGKVVVIGYESDRNDIHETVVGRVPGVVLLANYIESLLSQRYFWPAPEWVNVLSGFMVFAVFHFLVRTGKPVWILAGTGLLIILTFTALVFVLRVFYYYVSPLALTLLSIAAKVVTVAGEELGGRIGQKLSV